MTSQTLRRWIGRRIADQRLFYACDAVDPRPIWGVYASRHRWFVRSNHSASFVPAVSVVIGFPALLSRKSGPRFKKFRTFSHQFAVLVVQGKFFHCFASLFVVPCCLKNIIDQCCVFYDTEILDRIYLSKMVQTSATEATQSLQNFWPNVTEKVKASTNVSFCFHTLGNIIIY